MSPAMARAICRNTGSPVSLSIVIASSHCAMPPPELTFLVHPMCPVRNAKFTASSATGLLSIEVNQDACPAELTADHAGCGAFGLAVDSRVRYDDLTILI